MVQMPTGLRRRPVIVDSLTPNYWLSLAILAAPIVVTLAGVLAIRIVARAAERRLARSALSSKSVGSDVDGSAVRATVGREPDAIAAPGTREPGVSIAPQRVARTTYPTVPVSVWDLPRFARRRRRGESVTDFFHRMGLK
jgi:hypothetical protein